MNEQEGKFDVFYGTRSQLRSDPDLNELIECGWYICGFNTLGETEDGEYLHSVAVAFDSGPEAPGMEYDDDEEYEIRADSPNKEYLRTIQGHQNAFEFVNKYEGDGKIYMTPKQGEKELPDA